MSALANASSDAFSNAILDAVRPIFARAIWAWFDEHQGDVLFSKWFITVRVRDVGWLIADIAGERPPSIVQ